MAFGAARRGSGARRGLDGAPRESRTDVAAAKCAPDPAGPGGRWASGPKRSGVPDRQSRHRGHLVLLKGAVMNARTSVAIVLAVALSACHAGRPDLDTRTFELKYLREGEASALISPYVYADRPAGKGVFSVVGSTITVRETRDNLEKITRVLAEYDRPRPTLQLTFRLIEADGTPTVDPAIADVEAVLRKLFRFRGYRLAAEGVVSGVEGSQVAQTLNGPAGRYELGADIGRLSG